MTARELAHRLALVVPMAAMACGSGDTSSELVDLPTSVGGSFGRFVHEHVPLVVDEVERAEHEEMRGS